MKNRGERFRQAMARGDWTYASLAAASKVSTTTLTKIVNGQAVRERTAYRVARAMGGLDASPETYGIVVIGAFSRPGSQGSSTSGNIA